ncbi:SMP-30/gluconolactonase/LRE family protein [Cohnella zeiphila]|uniref:Regucalcin n=1 Tax=Cohnella zeiphila TaxID=2761120 RepID=A0A7X0VUV1_9BACL|nr:SMP-30/gluconolactonase/LRE family protein [Cohnella zeiphila]MBB6730795.1 SMP-30/gluconolactonase/LRE family protein [Cohnella zeiphila]
MSRRLKELEVELVCDAQSVLGEGPLWDTSSDRLYWVDIYSHRIHGYDPGRPGQFETMSAGPFVSSIVPRLSGGFAITQEDGFYRYDPASGASAPLALVETELPGNRFNDGKCDPAGRYVAGTMSRIDEPGRGSLYSLGSDGTVRRLLDGVGTSNGLAWSDDGRTMYYVDSQLQEIAAFDYDPATGRIAHRRVVAVIPAEDGTPDGMTIDAEGMLWLAHWNGWQVSRWDPVSGERIADVSVPVAKVTSVAFGGERLDELYITTARVGVTPELVNDQPHAGGVFRAKPGVRGTLPFAYRG